MKPKRPVPKQNKTNKKITKNHQQTNTNVLTKYTLSMFDIEIEAEENENCT